MAWHSILYLILAQFSSLFFLSAAESLCEFSDNCDSSSIKRDKNRITNNKQSLNINENFVDNDDGPQYLSNEMLNQ